MAKGKVTIQLREKSGKKKKKAAAAKEMTRLGGALRALGGIGGRMAGSLVGFGDTGASYGTDLGAAISRWLGSGDYSVSSNSVVQRMSSSNSIPSMHKDGQTIVVRHKEFITEVISNTAFTVQQQYSINPGISATFPWLSSIAQQYSEYRIKGMVYHYVPSSGNAVSSTNASLGTVMLQTSYRASEAAPTSKVELLNEYWASEAKPSEPFCHPIECDPKENPFNVQYIRTGATPSGDSVLMYDLGKTTLAVSGQQATGNVLGDLWCTYEIELRKPVLTGITNTSLSTLSATATTAINTTNCLGTNMTVTATSMPATVTFGTNTITFAAGSTGSYSLVVSYTSTTACAFSTPTISGVGSALIPEFVSTNGRSTTYTVGTGTAFNTVAFSITNPSTTTVLTLGATTLTGAGAAYLVITEVNPLTCL